MRIRKIGRKLWIRNKCLGTSCVIRTGRSAFRVFTGVTGVSSGFLIDPEGRVVLLNARGGWLDSKLAELYGNSFE